TQTSVVDQPPPVLDPATGLVDAGNCSVTAQWPVPTNAVSGIYLANIVNETPTYNPNLPPGPHSQNQMVFIVRNDGRVADFLFQTSDTNWQAYNQWTGLNLPNSSIPFLSSLYHQNWEPAYGGSPMNTPDSRAYKVSYNRPFKAVYASASAAPNDPSHPEYNDLKGDGVGNWVTFAEYPMVRWMESNGYDVTYWAGVDTDRRGSDLYTPIIVNGQPQLPNK